MCEHSYVNHSQEKYLNKIDAHKTCTDNLHDVTADVSVKDNSSISPCTKIDIYLRPLLPSSVSF